MHFDILILFLNVSHLMTLHIFPLLFIFYIALFELDFLLNLKMLLLRLSNFVGICIVWEDLCISGCLDVLFLVEGLEVRWWIGEANLIFDLIRKFVDNLHICLRTTQKLQLDFIQFSLFMIWSLRSDHLSHSKHIRTHYFQSHPIIHSWWGISWHKLKIGK